MKHGTLVLPKRVSALQRGLSVLSAVSKLGHGGVAEVRELTGLDKATIIRLLETLTHEGIDLCSHALRSARRVGKQPRQAVEQRIVRLHGCSLWDRRPEGKRHRDSSLTAKGEAERLTVPAFFKPRCSKPSFPFRT